MIIEITKEEKKEFMKKFNKRTKKIARIFKKNIFLENQDFDFFHKGMQYCFLLFNNYFKLKIKEKEKDRRIFANELMYILTGLKNYGDKRVKEGLPFFDERKSL